MRIAPSRTTGNIVEVVVHCLIWIYLFASPFFIRRPGEAIDWLTYAYRIYEPLSYCILFYLNYLWLVPRFFMQRRWAVFVLVNALLITLFYFGRDIYFALLPPTEWMQHMAARHARRGGHQRWAEPSLWMQLVFVVRNLISLAFIPFMAVLVRLSVKWRHAQEALREAELRRAEAELKNLKSQINPHFLLNTLNNIYALTTFDPAKAGDAVQELSRLLRYVLYETGERSVALAKEVEFLNTYIALMRMRLNDNVRIETHFDVPRDGRVHVAPLIFISLVENAFKHGINPAGPSFISISLTTDGDCLTFVCTNSNWPKTAKDKAPGGIGLQQVRRRLDLSYPGRYTWTYGPEADGQTYRSAITLNGLS